MADDPLRWRRQFAEELLLERGELRANLDDDQAERLLQWALELAGAMVEQTAVLDDATAEAAIEDGVRAISRVTTLVDRLTPELPDPTADPAGAWQASQPLLKALHELTGKTPGDLESRPAPPAESAFDYLYRLVTWEKEEEE
jgi:hypothetical protein